MTQNTMLDDLKNAVDMSKNQHGRNFHRNEAALAFILKHGPALVAMLEETGMWKGVVDEYRKQHDQLRAVLGADEDDTLVEMISKVKAMLEGSAQAVGRGTMPNEIWAYHYDTHLGCSPWQVTDSGSGTKYIRTDIHEMPCETVGPEDLEPGCCGPCRARAALSGQALEGRTVDTRLMMTDEQILTVAYDHLMLDYFREPETVITFARALMGRAPDLSRVRHLVNQELEFGHDGRHKGLQEALALLDAIPQQKVEASVYNQAIEDAGKFLDECDDAVVAAWAKGVRKMKKPDGDSLPREAESKPEIAAVPDGWKLVPEDPTADMCSDAVVLAMGVTIGGEYPWPQYMHDIYKTMLATAPQPPDLMTRISSAYASKGE